MKKKKKTEFFFVCLSVCSQFLQYVLVIENVPNDNNNNNNNNNTQKQNKTNQTIQYNTKQINPTPQKKATMAATSRSGTIFATGAALLSIAAAVFYLKQLQSNKKCPKVSPSSSSSSTPTNNDRNVDPNIKKLFDVAAEESKKLTTISNTEKLILYSLYKQSREGDAPENNNNNRFSLNLVEKAKYSAWERLRGMNTTQAMIHYIEGVQQLLRHGSMDDAQPGMGGMEGLDLDVMVDDLPLEGGLGNKPSTLADSEGSEGFGDRSNMTIEQKLLRAASENNRAELEQILRQKPELANHRDEDGQSACHLAADKGATDALNLLLDAGADGSAADDDGITVLHAAVIGECIEACRLLLAHGVDPDQPDVDGDTPRKCAEEDGSEAMKALFAGYTK